MSFYGIIIAHAGNDSQSPEVLGICQRDRGSILRSPVTSNFCFWQVKLQNKLPAAAFIGSILPFQKMQFSRPRIEVGKFTFDFRASLNNQTLQFRRSMVTHFHLAVRPCLRAVHVVCRPCVYVRTACQEQLVCRVEHT